jgi:hypothetical protein
MTSKTSFSVSWMILLVVGNPKYWTTIGILWEYCSNTMKILTWSHHGLTMVQVCFEYAPSMLWECFKYGHFWVSLEWILNPFRILLYPSQIHHGFILDSSLMHPWCILVWSWSNAAQSKSGSERLCLPYNHNRDAMHIRGILLTRLYFRSKIHLDLSWRLARIHWASSWHMPSLCWANLSTHTSTSADDNPFRPGIAGNFSKVLFPARGDITTGTSCMENSRHGHNSTFVSGHNSLRPEFGKQSHSTVTWTIVAPFGMLRMSWAIQEAL